jgi:hypothetical protein
MTPAPDWSENPSPCTSPLPRRLLLPLNLIRTIRSPCIVWLLHGGTRCGMPPTIFHSSGGCSVHPVGYSSARPINPTPVPSSPMPGITSSITPTTANSEPSCGLSSGCRYVVCDSYLSMELERFLFHGGEELRVDWARFEAQALRQGRLKLELERRYILDTFPDRSKSMTPVAARKASET